MSAKDLIKDLEEGPPKCSAWAGRRSSPSARSRAFSTRASASTAWSIPAASSNRDATRGASRRRCKHKTPADGKIAGFAKIDGREIALVSNDFTVLGAPRSVINMKKIRHVKRRRVEAAACRSCCWANLPARACPTAWAPRGARSSRRTRPSTSACASRPGCSALLGQCYGSSTWYSAMSDFVVMRKGAIMAVASPNVTSIAIGKPIDPEELGGWKLLTGVSRTRGHGRGHRRAGARRGEAVSFLPPRATTWSRRPSARCRRAPTTRAGGCSTSCRNRATRSTTCARSSPRSRTRVRASS